MDQSKSIELQLIYSIKQETQSLEYVDKIVWNEELTQQISNLQQLYQKLNVIGLYGTLETIQAYLNQREGCTIKIDQQITNRKERGMLCLAQFAEINYLSFLANEEYFTQDIFKESAEITVYRFLRDICQNIILLPSQSILKGWKNNNHHYYKVESSRIKQYEIKKLSETELTVAQINLFINDDFQQSLIAFCTLQSQQNTRCVQRELSKFDCLDVFQKLLQTKKLNISQIDLSKNSMKIQIQYQEIIKWFQDKIEEQLKILIQQLIATIQEKNFWELFGITNKNQFKSDKKEFNKVNKIIIAKLRRNITIQPQPKLQKDQQPKEFLLNLIVGMINQNHFKDDFPNNILIDKQFQSLINEYNKEFKVQLKKNQQFFLNYFAEFDVRICQQNKYIISYSLYEPIFIKSNSKSEFIIEHQQDDQIWIKEWIFEENLQMQALQICYYSKSKKKQEQSIIILANLYKPVSYFLDCYSSNTKLVQKINYEINLQNKNQNNYDQQIYKDTHLYHYDQINTSLYIFNTKIGITKIQYDEERKQIQSEKTITTALRFKYLCYLQHFEHFILMCQDNNLYNWNVLGFNIQKIQIQINSFKPGQNSQTKYEKLMGTVYGNYYCLVNQQKCDILNFNNEIIIQVLYQTYNYNYFQMIQIGFYVYLMIKLIQPYKFKI